MRPFLLAAALACPAVLLAGAGTADSVSCGQPTTRGGATEGTACPDVIVAGPGVKRVDGGGGADRIYVSRSGVTVAGGAGDDLLVGEAPQALAADCSAGCQLGLGSQTFDGGPGDDVVYGERGNDVLNGNGGNDRLYGGIGDDTVSGGGDNDLVSGGWGVDTVDGQAGDDLARGDGSADRLRDSGGGTDTISFATAVPPGYPQRSGYPTPPAGFPGEGGERGVYVDLGGGTGDNGEPRFGGGLDVEVDGADFENVIGSPFSDYIVGNSGANKIYAGGGADVVLGGDGNDEIHGGADGDDLDGQGGSDSADGEAGADHCVAETQASCGAAAGVVTRDATKVSVGQVSGGPSGLADVYLAGSNIADNISAAYAAGSPATVTFTVTSGSAIFNSAAAAAGGCAIPTSTQAVCTLAGPLDALVLFGGAGADHLDAPGFPSSASVMLAGGTGSDTLGGGDLSEDVLVDDPSTAGGADHLAGLGRDDALLNNEGADHVDGGGGNDLVLSSSICDGDQLAGGPQRDNAAYPRLDVAVEANLVTGLAGHPGGGSTPVCAGAGEQLDSLTGFEDMEGSDHADAFFGDLGSNNLLGWGSADLLRGGGGDDRLFANAGDDDPQGLCGDGLDRVLLDRPPSTDSAADDCEIVEQADPGTFGFTIDPLPDPTFSASDPPSPADDNSPSILGTAVAGSTVRLYSSADCASPSLVAAGSAAEFASPGVTVQVPDNSTTTLRAIARTASSASECSAGSISYTESTPTPPSVDPTAVGDFATVPENSGPTAIDVLANDTDPDGGPKTVASVTAPAQGTAAVSADGSAVTYAPPPGWCGQDAFSYALNGGSSATVTISVTCAPTPRPPTNPPPVRHCGGAVVTRAGSPGRDVIRGTAHRDVIAALGGDDLVRGLGGNDVICGGSGRDRLLGGPGRDLLLGGPGHDQLFGGPGRDRERP